MPAKKSPLFRVTVDGRPIRIPAASDLSSLDVGFFCGREGPGNLYSGGIRSRNGIAVHTKNDARCLVPEGKTVTIKYERNQPSAQPLDMKRLLEGIEQSQEEYERLNGPTVDDVPREILPYLRTRTFSVRTPGKSQLISARLNRDTQLGASVYWCDGRCVFSVHSRRKQYIKLVLKPRQQVSILLMTSLPKLPRCRLCGKFKYEAGPLVAGDSWFTCDQCEIEIQRLIRRLPQ